MKKRASIPAIPVATFEALESKFTDIYPLETDIGTFYARMPTRPELDRATKKVADKKLIEANEELSRSCIVYPNEAETLRLFEAYPLLSAETGEAITRISQGKVDPSEKPQGTCSTAPATGT